MRLPLCVLLGITTGCSSALYTRYAGPANGTAGETYACVQEQLKAMGYTRTQYDASARWYLAQKITMEPSSSGLYRHTLQVLDTRVKSSEQGGPTLEITARTFDEYASARGQDRQERKASDRVQLDARALGQACAK